MLGIMMTYYLPWENRRFVRRLLREKQPEFAAVRTVRACGVSQITKICTSGYPCQVIFIESVRAFLRSVPDG